MGGTWEGDHYRNYSRSKSHYDANCKKQGIDYSTNDLPFSFLENSLQESITQQIQETLRMIDIPNQIRNELSRH